MHLQSLALRNYRVYRRLDLDLPDGLVGIYGPNGAGKSTLIEAIRYALYGEARTDKAGLRSDGVGADTEVILDFEHEGNAYRVRRVLRGQNFTPAVQVQRNGLLEVSGVRDANTFLSRVLGMDQRAFLASVCAQQKELTAFTAMQGGERRRLVLDLLGVSPVERALARVREASRDMRAQAEGARATLPDLADLGAAEQAAAQELAAAKQALGAAAGTELRAQELQKRSRQALAGVEARHAELTRLAQEHAVVATAEQRHRAEAAGHHARAETADKLRQGLAEEEQRLAAFPAAQEALRAHERRRELAGVRRQAELALADAQRRAATAGGELERLKPLAARHVELEVQAADADRAVADATGEHQQARERYSEGRAALKHATERLDDARQLHASDGKLDPSAPCPTCGQPLGAAFEEVRERHAVEESAALAERERLATELDAIERAGRKLATSLGATQRQAATARKAERDAAQALGTLQAAERAHEMAAADVAGRERELAGGPDPGYDEVAHHADADALEALRALATTHAANAERVAQADKERALATAALERADAAAAEVARLAGAITSLGPVADELAAAQRADREADEQAKAAHASQARALAEQEAAVRRVADRQEVLALATKAHEQVVGLEDDAAYLLKLSDLVSAFKSHLVARLSRRLQAEAARLFAELTDDTYQDLEVDPEDYDVRIADGGVFHPLSRFSGSENDLASLSVRVAISLVISEGAGDIGLLVLDEVLGSLDRQRRERMLAALTALQSRFRQVLLVTHNDEVKDLLPAAIEVRPGPGRTATATLVA